MTPRRLRDEVLAECRRRAERLAGAPWPAVAERAVAACDDEDEVGKAIRLLGKAVRRAARVAPRAPASDPRAVWLRTWLRETAETESGRQLLAPRGVRQRAPKARSSRAIPYVLNALLCGKHVAAIDRAALSLLCGEEFPAEVSRPGATVDSVLKAAAARWRAARSRGAKAERARFLREPPRSAWLDLADGGEMAALTKMRVDGEMLAASVNGEERVLLPLKRLDVVDSGTSWILVLR